VPLYSSECAYRAVIIDRMSPSILGGVRRCNADRTMQGNNLILAKVERGICVVTCEV